MKIRNILFTISIALLALYSCESVEHAKFEPQTDGLLSFSVSIPGEGQLFNPTVKGPYAEGETIYIKVPSPYDDPLDVSKLVPYASLQDNCYMKPALPSVIDFTEPYAVTVINALGESKTNYVEIVPTPPKTTFNKLWFKTNNDLDITWNNWISSIAVNTDYLFVYDGVENYADSEIKVYNRTTAEFVKNIAVPQTFLSQIRADDAGHLTVARYNIYGAGFMLYFYETIDSVPQLLLNYTHDEGAPVMLGYKYSVVGNLKTGKACVYATCDGARTYYYWEFVDGVPVNHYPTAVEYTGVNGYWYYANIQASSVDPQQDLYISFLQNVEGQGSHFQIYNPVTQDILSMDQSNHLFRIFGFNVFGINDDKFLAILHQAQATWDATYLKVFDISDEANLGMTPSSPDYDNFMIFESEAYGEYNINMWGDVASYIDGNDVYIYAPIIANERASGGVMAYRMRYYPQ